MPNFSKLSHYQERRYVPQDADLTKVDAVQRLYEHLVECSLNADDEFEQWILDRSELEAALDQQGSILYIQMTCQTDDQAYVAAYKDFIETVVPTVKPLADQLNQRYLKECERFRLDDKRYEIYRRAVATEVDIFVQDNVPLETKVELLSQEYQSICGAMTVSFGGKDLTLPQMAKFLLDPDRSLRERAWRASSQRRLEEKMRLDDLFDQMMGLRNKIARNAGFDNFCAYKFRSLHRFDYTPQDCKKYHATIEDMVVPLWKEIYVRRKQQMKLEQLRPWDISVDPLGRTPLKPFDKVEQLGQGCQEIFGRVDKNLGAQFTMMLDSGLLDLANRKGKAPGGYQSTLNEARKPFIFMNAVGVDSDVRTLLHEGGHAFHALACSGDPLLDYRHGPMEFNEVASMSMELLGEKYLDVFYNPQDKARSSLHHLEDIIFTLVWVATIDAFQHWIYENPEHTAVERKAAWLNIRKRFGSNFVQWEGLEEEHAYLWHRQLHIFEVPFYYIEYGIAQLGALQIWLNSEKDWAGTIAAYRRALALGGSRPLPELFSAANIRFDFTQDIIAPLMTEVKKELKFS